MKVCRSACFTFLFLSAFLLHTDKLMASPGAVPPGACLYALDTTASAAFQIAGAQSTYTACGVVVESTSSSGFEMEGAGTLYLENHAQVSVVGGANLTGQTELWDTISNKQVQAVQTTSPGDPLASIAAPTTGTIVGKTPTYYDMNSKPANNTISPGIYCGGLTIGNTNGTAFKFNPGIYVIAGGGLVLNSQADVTGTGVTFYNTSSAGWGCASSYNYTPITISGQVTAALSAPTSSTYNGILFFGNRTGCSTKGSCTDQINGGSTAILNGALYFASDEILITGSNASGFMELVADKIYINGNSNFGNNGNPFDGITVSVSPSAATLSASQTQQFTAAVANTANTAVTWTISPSAGSINSSGLYTAPSSITVQQTVTVTATSQADTSKTGTATITLTPPVVKTTPTITWPTPAAITYGAALSSTQLDATASVAGTFAYSPAAGTVLTAGSQTLSVTFTPTNTTLYNTATGSVSLTVNKASLTVTASSASVAYGSVVPAITPSYSGFVNGDSASSLTTAPICTTSYTPTTSVSTSPVATTCFGGVSSNYSFTYVAGSITITKATASVTAWPTASAITYGQSLSASTLTGGTHSTAGSYAWTAPSTVPAAGTQSESVTFTPSDTVDFNAVSSSVSVVVSSATLTVTASSASVAYGSAVPAITPSYSGFVNGDSAASLTTAPTCTTSYTPTTSVSASPVATTCSGGVSSNYSFTYVAGGITITKATASVTAWPTASAITYGQALSASPLSGGTASTTGTFAWTAPSTLPSVGTQSESVTFTPSDTVDFNAVTSSVSVVVNPAVSITISPSSASLSAGQTQQFAATVSNTSNTAVTWTISPTGLV